ncbi:MAG: hypothetical protein A2X34_04305 [Elusimicrobia bacterium GWC2_51_8]|nr:MAG: hypothetical protein A2X33_03625 [Elusimicrobia bacterium GWA2_51_34]OGR59846.1 MAG: hypothetical protein A2X34_04305 [Elusimicrobia bacterium GWC2_51_8]OGR88058.1 MAG: hypothetical protein A2021_06940 [Elusimicrobia bacterium GWF2_52_66]HAF95774.1 hypothetical protein [Elusimicrobiota bacterium]HCE99180.1 hypothetical protein [Elusimicrobiota bacterium]
MRHEDLEIWKKGYVFALSIYKVTNGFPREETYGLTSQLRRAALSIPLNIAEGSVRSSTKDFLHFLNIAEGSLAESYTLIKMACDLGYLSAEKREDLLNQVRVLHHMLNAFEASIRRKSKL